MQGNVSDSPEAGPASSARFHSAVTPECLIHGSVKRGGRHSHKHTGSLMYSFHKCLFGNAASTTPISSKEGPPSLKTYKYVTGCPTWRRIWPCRQMALDHSQFFHLEPLSSSIPSCTASQQ